MTVRTTFIAASAALLLTPALASADSTATATIEAELTKATDITNTAGLNFGTFALNDGQGGQIIVTPDGGTTTTAGARALDGQAAALFEVTGPTGQSFTLRLPEQVQITGESGGTMQVRSFTTDCTGTQQFGAGPKTCAVGGTLAVAANSTAGLYRGNFDVSVVYE